MSSSSAPPTNEQTNRKKYGAPNRKIPSRPTTPLRSSSRMSMRESAKLSSGCALNGASEIFEPAFAELSDSMADLEANIMHLQLMHESLSRFNENFSSFLYGLHMNAFCVDFPEAPLPESFHRANDYPEKSDYGETSTHFQADPDGDTTFMYIIICIEKINYLKIFRTTDTSFIENPPVSSKNTAKIPTSVSNAPRNYQRRGSLSWGRTTGRGSFRGSQGSGIARTSKSRDLRN